MRSFLAWLVVMLSAGTLALGGLAALALDAAPSVERPDKVSPWVVARARWLLRYHDPRTLARDQVRNVAMAASDLDELINYGISRRSTGRSRLTLARDLAKLQVSLRLPDGLVTRHLGRYLNLGLELAAPQGRLEPRTAHWATARTGALLAALYRPLLRLAGYGEELTLVERTVQRVSLAPRRAVLTYAWQPELLDKAREAASDSASRAALKDAQSRLATLLEFHPQLRRAPLPLVLRPLLEAEAGREAARATLLVLAARLANKKLDAVIPEAATWPQVPPAELSLHGRVDWAQHFIVSAAIAAWAGEPSPMRSGSTRSSPIPRAAADSRSATSPPTAPVPASANSPALIPTGCAGCSPAHPSTRTSCRTPPISPKASRRRAFASASAAPMRRPTARWRTASSRASPPCPPTATQRSNPPIDGSACP